MNTVPLAIMIVPADKRCRVGLADPAQYRAAVDKTAQAAS